MDKIRIPVSEEFIQLADDDLSLIVKYADFLVKFCTFRTGRKCFFRTYIMASVLRKVGVSATMNVGLHNLNSSSKPEGHCWLTINGYPFEEKNNPEELYPFKIAYSPNDICYWVGN